MHAKVGKDAVEWRVPTCRHCTFRPSFRAGVEMAEAPEIGVCPRFEQESVDLMIGNTKVRPDLPLFPERHRHGPSQAAQQALIVDPKGEIDILALVPQADPAAPILGETRYLLPKRPCCRTDNRDGCHFRESAPDTRDHVCRPPEIPLRSCQQSIVLFQSRAPRFSFRPFTVASTKVGPDTGVARLNPSSPFTGATWAIPCFRDQA